jgi:hypothetical protein
MYLMSDILKLLNGVSNRNTMNFCPVAPCEYSDSGGRLANAGHFLCPLGMLLHFVF